MCHLGSLPRWSPSPIAGRDSCPRLCLTCTTTHLVPHPFLRVPDAGDWQVLLPNEPRVGLWCQWHFSRDCKGVGAIWGPESPCWHPSLAEILFHKKCQNFHWDNRFSVTTRGEQYSPCPALHVPLPMAKSLPPTQHAKLSPTFILWGTPTSKKSAY